MLNLFKGFYLQETETSLLRENMDANFYFILFLSLKEIKNTLFSYLQLKKKWIVYYEKEFNHVTYVNVPNTIDVLFITNWSSGGSHFPELVTLNIPKLGVEIRHVWGLEYDDISRPFISKTYNVKNVSWGIPFKSSICEWPSGYFWIRHFLK